MTVRYSLVECPSCGLPSVIAEDFIAWDRGLQLWEDPRVIYPQRSKWLNVEVPQAVRECFEEARTCLQAGANTAAAVMCRRTLEAVCMELGASGKTLIKQLEALKDAGKIDPSLFEWANALRVTGNNAAHATGPALTRNDARDAIDFTEAIVDYLYVFKKRFTEFMERQKEPG